MRTLDRPSRDATHLNVGTMYAIFGALGRAVLRMLNVSLARSPPLAAPGVVMFLLSAMSFAGKYSLYRVVPMLEYLMTRCLVSPSSCFWLITIVFDAPSA